jgi:hypothetical protein
MKFPNEFLGHCQICLSNTYLSDEPCRPGHGNGMPLSKEECPVYQAREDYRRSRTLEPIRDVADCAADKARREEIK